MGNIIAAEAARTTVSLITAPFTISVNIDIGVGMAERSNRDGWSDRAILQLENLEVLDTDNRYVSTDYSKYVEFDLTSTLETTYGSPDTSVFTDWFNVYNDKMFISYINFFGAGDARNYINYFYEDYTGAPLPSITWTISTDLTTDLTWDFPDTVCQPMTWDGLTTVICLLAQENPTTHEVRARVVAVEGESTIATICSMPVTSPASEMDFFIIPGTGKNYFLSKLSGAGVMSAWTASSATGANLTEDLLTFQSADVSEMLTNQSDIGYWLLSADHFTFICDRYAWDQTLGNAPVTGLVVVRLRKDFTSYEVRFITWGDAEAQAKLDEPYKNFYVAFDADGNLFYADPYAGTPEAILIEDSSSVADAQDPAPRFPEYISAGATGGPGFRTSIPPDDRGSRFEEWSRVRGRYDVSHTVKDPTQIAELTAFFRVRRGKAKSFRFKDWNDYQLPDPGDDLIYQEIFVTDGVTELIQLTKRYEDAAGSYVRKLTRPLFGSVVVFDNGVVTVDYNVNYQVGTLSLHPIISSTVGHVIAVNLEFDILARFDTDRMNVTIVDFEQYDWPGIPIIELKDGTD